MWIPRWLGESYSKLYLNFKEEIFTAEKAKLVLGISNAMLNIVLSRLHLKRIVLIFEPSRPRKYRLVTPSNFLLLTADVIKNIDKIKQERYFNLIFTCFNEISKKINLTSFAVYGSVARGVAKKDSDIDILLVSKDFKDSLGLRLEALHNLIKEPIKSELNWLSNQEIMADISFHPLQESEIKKHPPILLDLVEDAIILYDKNQFLESELTIIKSKLIKMNAKRVFINEENWYWDLKPGYKFGEAIEI